VYYYSSGGGGGGDIRSLEERELEYHCYYPCVLSSLVALFGWKKKVCKRRVW